MSKGHVTWYALKAVMVLTFPLRCEGEGWSSLMCPGMTWGGSSSDGGAGVA